MMWLLAWFFSVVWIVRAPGVVYEDQSVAIQIRVEPRAENRLLITGLWEGDTSLTTSLEQLDGEDAPRIRWVKWKRLPVCEDCEVRAYVFGQGGQLGMDRRPMRVLARF